VPLFAVGFPFLDVLAAIKAMVAGPGPVCRLPFLSLLPTTCDHGVVSACCGAVGEEEGGVGAAVEGPALAIDLVIGPDLFAASPFGGGGGGASAADWRCLASSLLFSLLLSFLFLLRSSDIPFFLGASLVVEVRGLVVVLSFSGGGGKFFFPPHSCSHIFWRSSPVFSTSVEVSVCSEYNSILHQLSLISFSFGFFVLPGVILSHLLFCFFLSL